MDDADDIYRATIGELLANFRSALLAILPVATKAMISYQDDEMHRDWERLATSMFDAFVRSPISSDEAATGTELPLARYDIDFDDYFTFSWLASDADAPYSGAIVRFMSQAEPFDLVQVVDIDPDTLRAGNRRIVAVGDMKPALYRRRENGEALVTTHVSAVE